MVVTFEESSDWKSYEAVNNWARDQLQGLTTVAADGSQIDPVTEFEQPIGLVQVVWMANHHASEGESEGYTLKELDEEPGAQGKKDKLVGPHIVQ